VFETGDFRNHSIRAFVLTNVGTGRPSHKKFFVNKSEQAARRLMKKQNKISVATLISFSSKNSTTTR
jgi:hypothetical protein